MAWRISCRIEADDARLDGQAVRRRRLQVADVADAQQRQVQRARDRRGGQRQHVHRLPQLLEPFLVLDAEALLLVDDDQAQVLELHVGADQAVRADDDVDCRREPAVRRCVFCSPAERKRLMPSTTKGYSARRWLKVRKCCSASTVVGTSTATCWPLSMALKAARMASSVLP